MSDSSKRPTASSARPPSEDPLTWGPPVMLPPAIQRRVQRPYRAFFPSAAQSGSAALSAGDLGTCACRGCRFALEPSGAPLGSGMEALALLALEARYHRRRPLRRGGSERPDPPRPNGVTREPQGVPEPRTSCVLGVRWQTLLERSSTLVPPRLPPEAVPGLSQRRVEDAAVVDARQRKPRS
jgi:hypothetical protein